MATRGIRGATTASEDTPTAVLRATRELLETIVEANTIDIDDVASIIFTVTQDLSGEYPARAAREMGWTDTALLGATEMDVPGGLRRCIRVLLHVNTERTQREVKHVYLHDARVLRPDRA
ncbi:MAG: chorismate mutase [Gemmatimonadales bacterium]